jgi:hypothetical protein
VGFLQDLIEALPFLEKDFVCVQNSGGAEPRYQKACGRLSGRCTRGADMQEVMDVYRGSGCSKLADGSREVCRPSAVGRGESERTTAGDCRGHTKQGQ